MIGIINCSSSGTKLISSLYRIYHCFSEILENKVEYRCCSSASRRSCSGIIIVGGNCSAKGHCQMRMCVYRSRKNQFAFGINDMLCKTLIYFSGNLNYFSVFNTNISLKHIGSGHYRSVFYNHIHIYQPPYMLSVYCSGRHFTVRRIKLRLFLIYKYKTRSLINLSYLNKIHACRICRNKV